MSAPEKYSRTPNITVVGGGTGSYNLLQELKYLDPNIKAVLAGADRGGNTKILRDELGVLPPGDERQGYAALAEAPELRELLSFRFPEGSGTYEGEVPGNMVIAALELMYGKAKAVKAANAIFRIAGSVYPVSLDSHDLVMHDGDEIIVGEGEIDHRDIKSKYPKVHLYPQPNINPDAERAIAGADIIVVAPGSIYTSLLAVLSVKGMATAFAETNAKKIVVANMATTQGQTDGWNVVDHIRPLAERVGPLDYTLYNNHVPSEELLKRYAAEGERLVDFSLEQFRGFHDIGGIAIGDNFVAGETDSGGEHKTPVYLRHDARKVGRHIMRIFYTD